MFQQRISTFVLKKVQSKPTTLILEKNQASVYPKYLTIASGFALVKYVFLLIQNNPIHNKHTHLSFYNISAGYIYTFGCTFIDFIETLSWNLNVPGTFRIQEADYLRNDCSTKNVKFIAMQILWKMATLRYYYIMENKISFPGHRASLHNNLACIQRKSNDTNSCFIKLCMRIKK